MKTTTNFKKTAIRSGAVIVSFVLISFTVSAQEFWKKLLTNSSFNEIAIAMIDTNSGKNVADNSTKTGADWISFDKAFDPVLELEGWMSDEQHFNAIDFQWVKEKEKAGVESTALDFNYLPDAGEVLALEDWMVEDSLWLR